jgi:hypothetical protein
MATLSNGYRELDRWARDYEKRRGRIVTPKRDEKFRRQEEARQRYTPEQRRAYADRKRAEAAKKDEAQTATETRNQRAILAARQADMKQHHSAQWAALSQRHREQRNGDYQAYRSRVSDERKRHDEARVASAGQRKAEWRDHYKAVRSAEKTRQRLEKSPTGLLALAITAAREERRQGATEGLARLTWANLISRERREAVYSAAVERDKAALVARQNFARDKALEHLSERRGQEIVARRGQQQEERDTLKREQAAERGEIREQWQQLNERRDRLKELQQRTKGKTMYREEKPGMDARDMEGSEQGAKRQNDAAKRQTEERTDQWRKQRQKDTERNTDASASAENAKQQQKDRQYGQDRQKTASSRQNSLSEQARNNIAGRTAEADHREQTGRDAKKERLERLSQAQPTRSAEERRASLERLQQPKERQPRDRSKDQDRDR